uniref:NADH dehydrogenase [ubiquinone] 1 beta subcomplex subunit 11, mitochondrial n=1 Tax=Scatophagus argus TaxID=75038 RepID=UPI001ED82DC8|nr:NADH dehydrogenase [ubiquinone] 1 beta subcomplex subunit 11, mitochondrial [Scatophagus argus]
MLSRLLRFGPVFSRSNAPARFVSQSKPTGAGSTAVTEVHPAAGKAGHGEVSQYVKNPDYHGFSIDPEVDVWTMKLAFFFGISLALVVGGTYIYYLPDHGMRQWARREAERVIQQREKENLPLIDENYYDPNKIIVPAAGEA